MIEVSSVKELVSLGIDRISVACGNFDGLHRGHTKIIDRLLEQSALHNSFPVVLTFDPHPREVLTGKKVYSLTSVQGKKKILQELGVEALIRINFTKEFAAKTADQFVNDVLIPEGVSLIDLCIGSEWRFGKGREGDIDFLRKNFRDSFEVHAIEEELDSGMHISSSRIRQALKEGDFNLAEKLLGRKYAVSGPVVKGRGIASSELSFPTANIDIYEQYLPLAGVFACIVKLDDDSIEYPAVCNIGFAPTFSASRDESARVEVHIIDFNENIYGKNLEVTFVAFLRSEIKFDSVAELKVQIEKDVEAAAKILKA